MIKLYEMVGWIDEYQIWIKLTSEVHQGDDEDQPRTRLVAEKASFWITKNAQICVS